MDEINTQPPELTGAAQDPASSKPPVSLEFLPSRQLCSWLFEQKLSITFTTYQSGKVFFVGLNPNGQLSVFERTFNRCMGLCLGQTTNTLYMSSLYQLWRFENVLQPGQLHESYDVLYVPQVGYTTGDIDIHDIGIDEQGRPIFVNTLFSCLATTDEQYSFTPVWKPKFISKIAAEERCHLNGLAMEYGKPRYVTSISASDVADGWRQHRVDGGIVIDVQENNIITVGLSMPHSPRLYQDKLWLLNSGTGYFGYVDRKTGQFEPMTFCPGYLRGLSFYGNFAIVGLSLQRDSKNFGGLPIDETLSKKNTQARCGLYIIDLRSGDIVHTLAIEGLVTELYDVCLVPGFQRPMALGFISEEIRRVLSIGPSNI